jgi:inositol transport system ATP-binding protein
MPAEEFVLEMKGITKRFPGVRALNGAQLRIKKGEVHALIGENGAGKSTLMKILLGIYRQDEGEVIYKGKPVNFKNPNDALCAGISMIHQEISLIPTVDVAENIWIGREKKFSTAGLIHAGKRYEQTQELLNRLEIAINPRAMVRTLSVANMQLVELARAVSYNSDIIIMDEPTSSLTETEINLLYKIIRELSGKGTAIIFISHKLDEIYEICDHITVLRDGEYVSDHPAASLSKDQLIAKIAGREIKDLFPKEEASIGEVVLEVKGLTSGKVFRDINFSVHKGEILGFCGLVGAGRTEIMRALFGIDEFDSGEIFIDGRKIVVKSPKHAIKNGIGMVTEDRLHMGIVGGLPVKYNITLASLRSYCKKLFFIDRSKEKEVADKMVETLSVKTSSLDQVLGSLSGGNQQKVIVAKWLLTNPKVLILDEPTRGIDVGSKSEIHRLISRLAKQGMAVIMVSSEMPEVLGMSDRILVVRGGRLAGEFSRGDADQETLIKCAFGV